MNDTYQEELICVVCSVCGNTYWDWVDSTDTICGRCADFEPLDFDEYGEE